MDSVNAIEVEGLYHLYGERRALDGIDLNICKGEIFGLLGPNGGGKTTLFKILSTLLVPSGGQVRILSRDILKDPMGIRPYIGIVFQNPSLDSKLTVFENLKHQGHIYGLMGKKLNQRIDDVMDLVGLDCRQKDRVEILSGGLKRRLDLAKGLLHQPKVLVFDEPSTGLDPGARRAFWNDLERLRSKMGTTLVLTTHFIEEAERCDRVGILDQGRMVSLGTPEELKRIVGRDVIVLETEEDPYKVQKKILNQFGIESHLLDGALRIESEEGQALMLELYSLFRKEITLITLGKPTLEDVFFRQTGHFFNAVEN